MRVFTPVEIAKHAANKYLGVLIAAKYARLLNEFPRDRSAMGEKKLTTRAPLRANARTHALPMPLDPPVTIATCPLSDSIGSASYDSSTTAVETVLIELPSRMVHGMNCGLTSVL